METPNTFVLPLMNIMMVIQQHLNLNGITKVWLAKELNIRPQNLSKKFKLQSVDCDFIMRISEVLEHDFFQYFTKELIKNGVITPTYGSNIDYRERYIHVLEETKELYGKVVEGKEEKEILKKNTIPEKGISKLKTK